MCQPCYHKPLNGVTWPLIYMELNFIFPWRMRISDVRKSRERVKVWAGQQLLIGQHVLDWHKYMLISYDPYKLDCTVLWVRLYAEGSIFVMWYSFFVMNQVETYPYHDVGKNMIIIRGKWSPIHASVQNHRH